MDRAAARHVGSSGGDMTQMRSIKGEHLFQTPHWMPQRRQRHFSNPWSLMNPELDRGPNDPSPEEIRARTLEIQAEWSPLVRRRHQCKLHVDPIDFTFPLSGETDASI